MKQLTLSTATNQRQETHINHHPESEPQLLTYKPNMPNTSNKELNQPFKTNLRGTLFNGRVLLYTDVLPRVADMRKHWQRLVLFEVT